MLSRLTSSCLILRYQSRLYAANWNRPSPPPLPREQQLEFEELQRVAQTPLAFNKSNVTEADLSLHPDAREPLKPTFDGDVNPATGEQGGPKREPVGKWGDEGDWSFKGRVSDF
ncbi:hypothetical protein E1B28_000544 [Marasmius oreades]|uniref:Succinate dehydrogenase assembly factor 4, mitochondrial n=1 Tax=Marasmius oreades TaxID=181124 RepID=A0A9P8AEG5_9AGAR|nr:uncharacterized protein E1B28_000544 [Marasmius oreades]KAG7098622.1 hypothetical protein E1B28_000544 [Marasmius oreades]